MRTLDIHGKPGKFLENNEKRKLIYITLNPVVKHGIRIIGSTALYVILNKTYVMS